MKPITFADFALEERMTIVIDARTEQERLFPRHLKRVYADAETPTNQWEEIPPTLPDICLQLRSSITGASDPWQTDELIAVVEMLNLRVEQWHWRRWNEMDGAVLRMIMEAIRIGAEEIKQRALE